MIRSGRSVGVYQNSPVRGIRRKHVSKGTDASPVGQQDPGTAQELGGKDMAEAGWGLPGSRAGESLGFEEEGGVRRATWRGAITSATSHGRSRRPPGHTPTPLLGKGSKLEAALPEQGGSREVEKGGQDVTIPGCEPSRVWSRRLKYL